MEFYVEWRLKGDNYFDSFGNGFTLSRSESVQKMEQKAHSDDNMDQTLTEISEARHIF